MMHLGCTQYTAEVCSAIVFNGVKCPNKQSCEMSNFLHRQKFEFKILPQKRVIRDGYVFATKHVNPGKFKSLLDWFATFVIQFIFIEFGLNVNVPWLKSPH